MVSSNCDARTYIQAIAASILAFADKQFFKNLEEVKKVILAETGMGNRLCGSGKTKWVLIVSS